MSAREIDVMACDSLFTFTMFHFINIYLLRGKQKTAVLKSQSTLRHGFYTALVLVAALLLKTVFIEQLFLNLWLVNVANSFMSICSIYLLFQVMFMAIESRYMRFKKNA